MRLNRVEWRDVDKWREVLEPRPQIGIVLRLGKPEAQMHLQHPGYESGRTDSCQKHSASWNGSGSSAWIASSITAVGSVRRHASGGNGQPSISSMTHARADFGQVCRDAVALVILAPGDLVR